MIVAIRSCISIISMLAASLTLAAQEPVAPPDFPEAAAVDDLPDLPEINVPAASADPEDPTLDYGFVPRPMPSAPSETPGGFTYVPGEGVTISLLNDTSRLRLSASLSALMLLNEKRPFTSGASFLLLPDSPFGLNTNTFDLHARQSSLFASFEGPEFKGFTPRGTILTFFFNDNLAADNYGLLVYFAYGELANERWRFAGGLMQDIYNPNSPTVLTLAKLYGSGNTGSYRGALRLERFFVLSDTSQITLQGGIGEPIATLVTGGLPRINEDNGWPNVESRAALGLGEFRKIAGAEMRPFEVGISGIVGQIRTTRTLLTPPDERPTRVVDDVWGFGTDVRWFVTDRFGVAGEFYIGQSLGEYNGTILQNMNTKTFDTIRSRGGWGEVFVYLTPALHWHTGYGIDAPIVRDLAPTQFARNQTFFNTIVWDVNRNFQIGFEVDYRMTDYIKYMDAAGVNFMTQFLWKF